MRNRHERRKAAGTRKKLGRLNIATLDQHFDDVLHRARADFARTGEIRPGFECVADGEVFAVPANWPECIAATAAACAALRDSFRRRGVNRYVFVSECWMGKNASLRPADDPERGECVLVIAVERKGPRRYAFAGITRNAETATLGPWEMDGDIPPSWLLDLLDEGHSDRSPKPEPPLVEMTSIQDVLDHDSTATRDELGTLMWDQILQKDADGDQYAIFMALEGVVRSLVKDQVLPKGIGEFARLLRDYPDIFPMFSLVSDSLPSIRRVRRCKATLQHFICEKREAERTVSTIFAAFMSMYLALGTEVVGALNLADRIETWDPEYQSRLRQVGLRSSYELDDDEGHVFVAVSADRYPIAVIGRRDAAGDLFVCGVIALPQSDLATAVDRIRQDGVELITGTEAEQLLCKMQQVEGFAMEIWEVEDWGADEWAEQDLAQMGFAKAMNVQHVLDPNMRHGHVAGYRVRRSPNGLVLVPSDNDEDIFVAVRVETTKTCLFILGWLRGSEGKLPQFYQKNCWVIPQEALHDMEELPGKERLQAMPPFQERAAGPLGDSLEDLK